MTARLTTNRIWQLSYGLSRRDLAVVAMLKRVRLASVRQLERVQFSGQPRTARRVLHELTKRRVVTRLPRSVGGVRAGSAGHIYGLDVVGQHLSQQGGPAHGSRKRRPWTPGSRFVDHALAVTEVYVRLAELERDGAFELLAFEGEPECWRPFSRMGAPVILKPDAFVRLGFEDEEAWFFIEVDRGTESPRTLETKGEVYRTYWESGEEQERNGVFPRVLWLVPNETRLAELEGALNRARAESLSAVVTQERLVTALSNSASPNSSTLAIPSDGETNLIQESERR